MASNQEESTKSSGEADQRIRVMGKEVPMETPSPTQEAAEFVITDALRELIKNEPSILEKALDTLGYV